MSVFEKPSRRDKQVIFLLTAEEKARLEAAAKMKQMTVSDLIRNSVNAYLQPKKSKK